MRPLRPTLAGVWMLGLAFVAPPGAQADTPGVGNSTVPACISLVGSNGSAASASGAFTVTVRDLANNPIPFVVVAVDLSNAPDLKLCADQPDPGLTMNCAGSIASKFTDANGIANFTLVGAGSGPPSTLLNGGRIYAGGMLIGSPTVSAFDLDGASGVGANDVSLFFVDFGSGNPYGRSDFDCSGGVGANDFSVWLAAFGSGTQTVSCGSSCP